jgi:ParB/RepB/Spo0J family partition protein
MEQIEMKPKGWLKPPRQARFEIDKEELQRLADSLFTIGFLSPILATRGGEVVAGDRRRQAAMLHDGITDVPVVIVADMESRELRIRRVSENLQRVDISLYDKYVECRGFLDDEPDVTAKKIACLLNVDPSSITRYLSLDNCIEEVHQAVRDKRIGVKACYKISLTPPEQQPRMLAEALAKANKTTQDDAGTVPVQSPAKLSNVKIPLPGEKSIVIKGEHSLDELARLLRKALNGVDAARSQHIEPGEFDAFMQQRTACKAKPEPAKKMKAKA